MQYTIGTVLNDQSLAVLEAVHPLRGHAGTRQVEGAERCVISTGGTPCIAAAAVLHTGERNDRT